MGWQIEPLEEGVEALQQRERAVRDWWALARESQSKVADQDGSSHYELNQHFRLWEMLLRNRKQIYWQMIADWRKARPDQVEQHLKTQHFSQPSPWLSKK
ncbi:hypothetical protein CIG75_01210 [Tumebacillus algifaecis]|uniref:Uncharacterized protein n=2 Tax=Tumebacillus algifaecis TaxID=1214604 RepID=A0A223CWM2_9BACL|nr:hypothetical protein CIG75_01210 [Tumebacillus algifaecis]